MYGERKHLATESTRNKNVYARTEASLIGPQGSSSAVGEADSAKTRRTTRRIADRQLSEWEEDGAFRAEYRTRPKQMAEQYSPDGEFWRIVQTLQNSSIARERRGIEVLELSYPNPAFLLPTTRRSDPPHLGFTTHINEY